MNNINEFKIRQRQLDRLNDYCSYLYNFNQTDFTFRYNPDYFELRGYKPEAPDPYYYQSYGELGESIDPDLLFYIIAERLMDGPQYQERLGDYGIIHFRCSPEGLNIDIHPDDENKEPFEIPQELLMFH